MKTDIYNNGVSYRLNNLLRPLFMRNKKKRLNNKDFSLLCNNCNGGILSHDLGLRFNSPTINLYFIYDHFIRFLEDLDYYLSQELKEAKNPTFTEPNNSPICTLGEGEKTIELHFLHYPDYQTAKDCWHRRIKRLKRENLYILFASYDTADESWIKRLDALPFKNKIVLVERAMPQYKSAYCISGYKDTGLGGLTRFDSLIGRRIIDSFDYINWFNGNH